MHGLRGKGLRGNRYGRLVVIDSLGKDGGGVTLWQCRCDCGEIVVELGTDLAQGEVTSCGECPDPPRAEPAPKRPPAQPAPTYMEHPAGQPVGNGGMPAVHKPPPAVAESVPRVTRRDRSPVQASDDRCPNVDDDPVGFYAWRLKLIRQVGRRVMRELEGDEREDLEELQLGGAA